MNIEALEKLSQIRKNGIINEAEFQAEKRKLYATHRNH
ncbi:MAG TPA: SHOCT domain-containing protein [Turneriella sp.]|nr:SHOCT domain-containing protein [Turneriella sp.]